MTPIVFIIYVLRDLFILLFKPLVLSVWLAAQLLAQGGGRRRKQTLVTYSVLVLGSCLLLWLVVKCSIIFYCAISHVVYEWRTRTHVNRDGQRRDFALAVDREITVRTGN